MPGGDGMPQLLTGNDFYTKVVEYEESVSREEAEKETRRVNKESQVNALTKAMEEWKIADEERQERNKAKEDEWKEAVAKWEQERTQARAERRRCHWNKPKHPKMEKATPKPKLKALGALRAVHNGPHTEEEDSEEVVMPQELDGEWETDESGVESDN